MFIQCQVKHSRIISVYIQSYEYSEHSWFYRICCTEDSSIQEFPHASLQYGFSYWLYAGLCDHTLSIATIQRSSSTFWIGCHLYFHQVPQEPSQNGPPFHFHHHTLPHTAHNHNFHHHSSHPGPLCPDPAPPPWPAPGHDAVGKLGVL